MTIGEPLDEDMYKSYLIVVIFISHVELGIEHRHCRKPRGPIRLSITALKYYTVRLQAG
jgi:hypothetical protein